MSDTKRKQHKPIYVGERNVFPVECILKRRTMGTKTEYLIKWVGYPHSENSWIDETDVTQDLVKEFNSVTQRRPRQASSATQTLNKSSERVISPSTARNNDSYFEEDLHNFGVNVQLLSVTDDVRLFSSPTSSSDSEVLKKIV